MLNPERDASRRTPFWVQHSSFCVLTSRNARSCAIPPPMPESRPRQIPSHPAMSSSPRSPQTTGLLYGIAAYGWWGFVAVYFRAVGHVPAPALLAHRIVWSVLVLAIIVALNKRWGSVRNVLREKRMVVHLAVSTILIAVNWFVFIWAVGSGRLLE